MHSPAILVLFIEFFWIIYLITVNFFVGQGCWYPVMRSPRRHCTSKGLLRSYTRSIFYVTIPYADFVMLKTRSIGYWFNVVPYNNSSFAEDVTSGRLTRRRPE